MLARKEEATTREVVTLELALWNGMPWMRCLTDRAEQVAVREQIPSLSFLVVRRLRSPDRDGCRFSNQCRVESK